MKASILLAFLTVLCLTTLSQPQSFKYQAVARNLSGEILVNKNVTFRISILQGSATGTTVYSELHAKTTSNYGLVDLEIGKGTSPSGSFSGISWGVSSYFLKVEMDPAGGISFQLMGTSQLLSVPYALYAKDVQNASVVPEAPLTGNGTASSPLKISDGGIASVKIADGAVTSAKLGNNSVDAAKIADLTVGTAELSNSSVTGTKIADGTITNSDIADNGITVAKISSSGAATNQVIMFTGSDVAWGGIPGVILRTTLINVANNGISSFSNTYIKVSDLGSFTKVESNSVVEAAFEGRIGAATLSGTGATFELRVDGNAPSLGRARATLRSTDTGYSGVPVSITGIFTGLSTGTHTLSMWVKTSTGSGTDAVVDPGGFGNDHIIVKEYR